MFWRKGRIVRENRKLISESTFPANHVYECHPAFGSIGDVGERKNDINIPNIPGEERDALLAKRAKLKELVDVIETSVEATDDKSTVTREWLEKVDPAHFAAEDGDFLSRIRK
ncbi:MAG: hypothetical protein ACLRSE_07245 [Alistipes finegoldii]